MKKEALDLVFNRRGFPVDSSNSENLLLFTDPSLRVKKFGDSGKSACWRNRNSRQPILSKSTGMIDIYFNTEHLELVTLNKKLYREAVKVYGVGELVNLGPERFSIKARGSPDMPKHIDSNLFYDKVNYPIRIQGLVCLEVGNDVQPRDSGTLSVYKNFHHYWDFAGQLFHPKTGLFPFPDRKSRFFVLPTGKKGWDKHYEPIFREHAEMYTRFLFCDISPDDSETAEFFERIRKTVKVPEKLLPLEWEHIVLKPGDVVFWNQHLPHRSLRNKSETPRIVSYYNLFPVERGWYGSEEQLWTKKQFREGKKFYSVNAGTYTYNCKNVEELEYLKKTRALKKIRLKTRTNSFRKRITGQKDWFV